MCPVLSKELAGTLVFCLLATACQPAFGCFYLTMVLVRIRFRYPYLLARWDSLTGLELPPFNPASTGLMTILPN